MTSSGRALRQTQPGRAAQGCASRPSPGIRVAYAELSRNRVLVDDHASVRSAGAQSMLEGVAC